MQHRVGTAIVCLHISAALYVLVGAALLSLGVAAGSRTNWGFAWSAMFMFCLILAAGVEVVAFGLNRRKFWAWVAGLCIFSIYVPSAFLPLGAIGLWALLDSGSQKEFLVRTQPGTQ